MGSDDTPADRRSVGITVLRPFEGLKAQNRAVGRDSDLAAQLLRMVHLVVENEGRVACLLAKPRGNQVSKHAAHARRVRCVRPRYEHVPARTALHRLNAALYSAACRTRRRVASDCRSAS